MNSETEEVSWGGISGIIVKVWFPCFSRVTQNKPDFLRQDIPSYSLKSETVISGDPDFVSGQINRCCEICTKLVIEIEVFPKDIPDWRVPIIFCVEKKKFLIHLEGKHFVWNFDVIS